MTQNINKFFSFVCDSLKKSSGSVEIIKTSGVSVLDNEAAHWINYGAENLEEIFTNVDQIIKSFQSFNEYNDISSQFMPDIMAILDDFAFHAAVFGVYYFSFETIFAGINTSVITNKNWTDKKALDGLKDTIIEVISAWEIELKQSEKIVWVEKMLVYCFGIKKSYSLLFEEGMIFEESKGYNLLKNLYLHVLSLQKAWSAL
jgi:predicted RNA-binding protein